MPSLLWLLFLMTLVMTAGCTKAPEAVEAPVRAPEAGRAKPTPSETDSRPAIIAFGDSLSEGLGVEPGKSFPDQLQRKLDKQGYRYRVVNMGVSGDTSTGGLGRIDYAISMKPEIVILELGGNDGLRGVPVASTKANLERMITAFQSAGASVLLAGMTLPPNYGPDYIRQFESAYRDLAAKYKLPLIPFSDAGHRLSYGHTERADAARWNPPDCGRPLDHRRYGLPILNAATPTKVS